MDIELQVAVGCQIEELGTKRVSCGRVAVLTSKPSLQPSQGRYLYQKMPMMKNCYSNLKPAQLSEI